MAIYYYYSMLKGSILLTLCSALGTCTRDSHTHMVYDDHAHAHAHARFISTTTKPLPDSATNTDYVTLTLTAFTTTPICRIAPA